MPSSVLPERPSSQRIRVAPEEVTLVVWPLAQQPLASLGVLIAAGAVSGLVAWSSGEWTWGVLVAAGLAISLWRTWLRVTYEVGLSGVSQTVLGRRRLIPWSAIQSCDVHAGGVLLSPDPGLASLSPLRGLYLPWLDRRDLNLRDKVLASLEYYLPVPPAPHSSRHDCE